ncbi:MAG: carbohydrate-binding module family 20 domain-containing protein [Arachidicoccus sp.]|nr:carbohydrate-binding module family 20 domain-containing protein [Arachidicoccus sp.]
MPENHVVFLTGNHSDLGNWKADNVILLEPQEHSDSWSASISINADEGFIEYKYGIYDTANNALVSFEEGENRVLDISKSKLLFSIVNDGFIRYN